MKIAFYSGDISFDPDALTTKGLGGSESALINLTREWKNNYPDDEITVYNNNSGRCSSGYNGIIWKSITDFNLEIRTANLDVLISLRDPSIFYMPYLDAKFKCLWSQDNMEELRLQRLSNHKYGMINIDQIFVISKFAYNDIKNSFPDSKIDIVRNGYNPDWVLEKKIIKNKPIAVYTSTPFRGLDLLANFWPIIYNECNKRSVEPQLKIYGGMALYNQQEGQFKKLYDKLNDLKNVTVKGSICQKRLYEELKDVSVMLYPNTHTETGCMAVTEALANNIWVVTTNKGALGEQVVNNKNGYLIDCDPHSKEYKDLFISNAITALIKQPKPENEGLIFTWSEQAERMRKILGEQLL